MDFKGTTSPYKVASDNQASERSIQLFCPPTCSAWQAPMLHKFYLHLTSDKLGSKGFFLIFLKEGTLNNIRKAIAFYIKLLSIALYGFF